MFFFNDTATTEIYTLSLHDALPILRREGTASPYPIVRANEGRQRLGAARDRAGRGTDEMSRRAPPRRPTGADRKSTRLNSSHANISYAVFCLKKKKKTTIGDI